MVMPATTAVGSKGSLYSISEAEKGEAGKTSRASPGHAVMMGHALLFGALRHAFTASCVYASLSLSLCNVMSYICLDVYMSEV